LDALAADAPDTQAFGTVKISAVSLDFTAYLGTPSSYQGWFESSDDQLNQYWYDASYTNELITDTFRADDIDPRGADSPGLDGKIVLTDGAKRDRDPYVGDVSVSGRTDYLTHAVGVSREERPRRSSRPPAGRRLDPACLDQPLHAAAVRLPYVLGDQQLGLPALHRRHRLREHVLPESGEGPGRLVPVRH